MMVACLLLKYSCLPYTYDIRHHHQSHALQQSNLLICRMMADIKQATEKCGPLAPPAPALLKSSPGCSYRTSNGGNVLSTICCYTASNPIRHPHHGSDKTDNQPSMANALSPS